MQVIIMIIQVAVLFGFSEVGTWISKVFHLPIPGSIVGLILLFLLLQTKLVKVKWVEKGGEWTIREMLLFFVPSAVGIIEYGPLLWRSGIQIVLTISLSTALVMLTTGLIAEYIFRTRKRRSNQRGVQQ